MNRTTLAREVAESLHEQIESLTQQRDELVKALNSCVSELERIDSTRATVQFDVLQGARAALKRVKK